MIIFISVIIPVYNAEKYLRYTVESLLNQSLRDIEIILVDDGSTDSSSSSSSICDEIAKDDNRVKVIHKENGGVSSARNNGIFHATGEYIMFVDADDYVEVNVMEALYFLIKESKCDILCCDYYRDIISKKNNKKCIYVQHSFGNREIVNKYDIQQKIVYPMIFADENSTLGLNSVWNKLYRRIFINQTGILFNEKRKHGEDWLFNIEVFNAAEKIQFVQKGFYHYVRREGVSTLFSGYKENSYWIAKETWIFFEKTFPYFFNEKERLHQSRSIVNAARLNVCNTMIHEKNSKKKKNLIESIFWDTSYCENYYKIVGYGIRRLSNHTMKYKQVWIFLNKIPCYMTSGKMIARNLLRTIKNCQK